jgi:hypothetical protein
MRCFCERAVRDERAAICDYLEAIGQRTIATRIRDGRHLEPRTCGLWTSGLPKAAAIGPDGLGRLRTAADLQRAREAAQAPSWPRAAQPAAFSWPEVSEGDLCFMHPWPRADSGVEE